MTIRTSTIRAFAVLIATVASIGAASAQGLPVQDRAVTPDAEAKVWIAYISRVDGFAIPVPMTRTACVQMISTDRSFSCVNTDTGEVVEP